MLIKASAGGGSRVRIAGKPMISSRAWRRQREALASFGDDHVLVERVTHLGTSKSRCLVTPIGNYVHLFERDCSVQRRHQKVLKKPRPGMTPSAAPRWAPPPLPPHAVWAVWAQGQSEFICEQDGSFFSWR